ncbi:MAG: M20/M25/M40 family metallo-hydrolase, partial [Myxococcota bacterium]|nr:M20/M25/M40 family metallo-hydrolase [Myxococcota bacterium]
NIIPDTVELQGTIRALAPDQRERLHETVRETAVAVAQGVGARAEVTIRRGYPVTWNDPELVERIRPSLARVAGDGLVRGLPRTGAEDFAFLAREVPGVYFWLGIREPGVPEEEAAPNHSPRFVIDESALPLGVRALSHVAIDFLAAGAGAQGDAPAGG